MAVAVVLTLSTAACTRRLYEGAPLPSGRYAVLHLGDVSVRSIDGKGGFVSGFGTEHLEMAPGPHRIVLGFERPATSIGLRDVPAQRGEGTCTIDFVAAAGSQYWLGTRPVGTDWTMRRWNGKWEGWIRNPSANSEDDIVARCSSSVVRDAPPPTPVVVLAPPPPPALSPAPAKATTDAPHVAADHVAADAPTPPVVLPVPIAPPSGEGSPPAESEGQRWIRIGTWNLGPAAERDDEAIAMAIERSFDLLTLIEAAPTGRARAGYEGITEALGAGWASVVPGAPKSYAIVFRSERIRRCPGWRDGVVLDSGAGRAVPAQCFEAVLIERPPGVDTNLPPVQIRIRTLHFGR